MEALIDRGRADRAVLADILDKVAAETLPAAVLGRVLALPADRLADLRDRLLSLLAAPAPLTRQEMVKGLPSAPWLDRETAQHLVQQALEDDSPAVRDQAVMALRLMDGS